MDYEKAYKEALDRAKTEIDNCGTNEALSNMIHAIFPEIPYNKNERLLDDIIFAINSMENWGAADRALHISWLKNLAHYKQFVSYDLNKASESYMNEQIDYGPDYVDEDGEYYYYATALDYAFRAGANWQRNQNKQL